MYINTHAYTRTHDTSGTGPKKKQKKRQGIFLTGPKTQHPKRERERVKRVMDERYFNATLGPVFQAKVH